MFGKTENPTFNPDASYKTKGDAAEGSTCYTRRHDNWTMCTINKGDANQTDGLIIVPDYFINPTNVSVKWCSRQLSANQFTSEQWALMEAAGAAFLPYAMRILKTDGGITAALNFSYWTSTASTTSGNHAYGLNFSGNYESVRPTPADPGCARRNGMSIRLVREL